MRIVIFPILVAVFSGCNGQKMEPLPGVSLSKFGQVFEAKTAFYLSGGGDAYGWANFQLSKIRVDSIIKEWNMSRTKEISGDMIRGIRSPYGDKIPWFHINADIDTCSKVANSVFPGKCQSARFDSMMELWQGGVGKCTYATLVKIDGQGYVYFRSESGCSSQD